MYPSFAINHGTSSALMVFIGTFLLSAANGSVTKRKNVGRLQFSWLRLQNKKTRSLSMLLASLSCLSVACRRFYSIFTLACNLLHCLLALLWQLCWVRLWFPGSVTPKCSEEQSRSDSDVTGTETTSVLFSISLLHSNFHNHSVFQIQ